MEVLIYFLQYLLSVLFYVLDLALLLRALLSWFDPMREWKISGFLMLLTEPIILPFRALCAKMHWFENTPLDMPFMMTWLALMLIQFFLPI